MMTNMRILVLSGLAAVLALSPPIAAQQPATPAAGGQPDHVAALKQSIVDGTKKLAAYEWIESTVISLKGEEKNRKQNRCYYGADGKVQKVPIEGEPQADASSRGGRQKRGGALKKKVIENKKDEMQEYMQRAAALIHSYVPPAPLQIQAVKDAGRLAVSPQASGRARLEMKQYLKPGDALTIDLDPNANRLLGLGVTSYLDTPEDAVTLAVQMNTLPDGALYVAQTTLDAKAKNIQVVITNSGHRPVAK